jgi:hypothetical protein
LPVNSAPERTFRQDGPFMAVSSLPS